MNNRADQWDRRKFLHGLTLAGTAGLVGLRPGLAVAEPPPETTRIRLFQWNSLCVTPQFVAEELLRSEGFGDIQYVRNPQGGGPEKLLASGEVDINSQYSAPLIVRVDAGDPVMFLAGLHVGCFELFGTNRVRTIHDLKGKTVAVAALGSVAHVFISTIVAYVGLDPRRDDFKFRCDRSGFRKRRRCRAQSCGQGVRRATLRDDGGMRRRGRNARQPAGHSAMPQAAQERR